eukprot:7228376-Pyramimonas_sp.AAC.1
MLSQVLVESSVDEVSRLPELLAQVLDLTLLEAILDLGHIDGPHHLLHLAFQHGLPALPHELGVRWHSRLRRCWCWCWCRWCCSQLRGHA